MEKIKLSQEQIEAIEWFQNNPPKYYAWFYKVYKKYLSYIVFFIFILVFVLGIFRDAFYFYNIELFDIVKIFFGGFMLIAVWSLFSYLYKHFYTKRYAKKIGLTLKQWNVVTEGMKWNI